MRCVVAAGLMVAACYTPHPQAGEPCDNGCPDGLVCSPASDTCQVTAIDASVDVPPDVPPPALPFQYRRRIGITNTSATALAAGFTVRVPLASLAALVTAGKVKSDFSDLRVIGDVAGERDRIIDPPNGPAAAAISFSITSAIEAGATSNDYALYYGVPAAGAAPADGTAVFPVYDDFAVGLSPIWATSDGPSTANGKLVLRANHTDSVTTNSLTDKLPIVSAIEMSVTITDPTSAPTVQPGGTFYYWFGYQHSDFAPVVPWVIWIARGASEVRGEQESPVGCEAGCLGPQVVQDAATHVYAIERDPTATRFYRDGALSFTTPVTNTEDYSVMARNFMAASDVQFDWIRARARVTPDPTVDVGAEDAL
jgi:hypothetical protein